MNKPLGWLLLYVSWAGVGGVACGEEFIVPDPSDARPPVVQLVSAIEQSNKKDSGPNVIKLASGKYTLELVHNQSVSYGHNGLPVIAGELTIQGVGASADATIIARSATAPWFRFFLVSPGAHLILNNLTLEGGLADSPSKTDDAAPSDAGGAIRTRGDLDIVGSILRQNVADNCGGAILNEGGALVIQDSVFAFNRVRETRDGGAVCVVGRGSVRVLRSTFVGNRAGKAKGSGGAIYNLEGNTDIYASTFHHNRAGMTGDGGALANTAGKMTVVNSTLYANVAGRNGGGIAGIPNSTVLSARSTDSVVDLINSTVFGNAGANTESAPEAQVGGGGVAMLFGDANLSNTIIAGNHVTAARATGPDCSVKPGTGAVRAQTSNIVGDHTGCDISMIGTATQGDPFLGGYTDDGVPGRGHVPLLPGSPAIGVGDADQCVGAPVGGKDQLDVSRPAGCALGAVEFYSNPAPANTPFSFFDPLEYLNVAESTDPGARPASEDSGGTVTSPIPGIDRNTPSPGVGGAGFPISGGVGGADMWALCAVLWRYARRRRVGA